MCVTEILSVVAVLYGFLYSLVNIVFNSFQSGNEEIFGYVTLGDKVTFDYVIYTSVIFIAMIFLLVHRAHVRATHRAR